MDDKEPFLARWSRRKLDAKADAPADMPQAVEPPAVASAAASAHAPEPAAPGSAMPGTREYREFFDPQVDERLRRAALKQLFSDPQFNVMDGLDTYVDDYSKPDPIPEAMLRQLNQAQELFLFGDENKTAERSAGAAPSASITAPASLPAETANADSEPNPATAGASDPDTMAAAGSAAATPEAGVRND